MKKIYIFLMVFEIVIFSSFTAFAANDPQMGYDSVFVMGSKEHLEKDNMKMRDEFEKDPIRFLENRKAEIQTLIKDGKITKEEATGKIERIDTRIREIRSFNKLTLKQKKEKLTKDCRNCLDKQVAEGKLDKAKADTIFKKYSERISNWDGNGYPKFHFKRFMEKSEKSNIH